MLKSSLKRLLSCLFICDEDACVKRVVGRQKVKTDCRVCKSNAGQGVLQSLPPPGCWGKGDSSCTELSHTQ